MPSKVNSQLSGKLSYTEWSSLYRFGSVLVFPAPFQLSLNTGPRKCHRTRQSCGLIWGPGTYQEQVPWASVFPCYFHECPFLQKLLWGEKQISLVRLMPSTLLEEVVRRPLSGRLKLWCFPEDQRAASSLGEFPAYERCPVPCIRDSGFGDGHLSLSGVFRLKVCQAPDTLLATEWSKQWLSLWFAATRVHSERSF